jgi:hypothetical protein
MFSRELVQSRTGADGLQPVEPASHLTDTWADE